MNKVILNRITDIGKLPVCIGLLKCVKSYIEHEGTDAENYANVGDIKIGMPCYMKDDEYYHAYHVTMLSDGELKDGDFCYHPDFGFQACCDMSERGMQDWEKLGWKKVSFSTNPEYDIYGVGVISIEMMNNIIYCYKLGIIELNFD